MNKTKYKGFEISSYSFTTPKYGTLWRSENDIGEPYHNDTLAYTTEEEAIQKEKNNIDTYLKENPC